MAHTELSGNDGSLPTKEEIPDIYDGLEVTHNFYFGPNATNTLYKLVRYRRMEFECYKDGVKKNLQAEQFHFLR